jgi:redox-sensitive bicupin YhaK (pirin superfamily)
MTTIVENAKKGTVTVRPSEERGKFRNDWLDARYTFSFNRYMDRNHVQFRSMRVLNEDKVAPGQGFGMHPHDNMEILTWILDGALEHKDTSGGGGQIRHGELQHMSAGTGVFHSEFNPSKTEATHLFQIWLFPEKQNLEPGYSQKSFPAEGRRNRLQRIASYGGAEGAIQVNQDAEVFALDLDAGAAVTHQTSEKRGSWLQLAKGAITVNGTKLEAGDGAAITGAASITIEAAQNAHLLLFDLA